MAMIKLLAISLEMNNLMHMVQPFTWVLTENGASFSLNCFITSLFTTPLQRSAAMLTALRGCVNNFLCIHYSYSMHLHT